MGDNQKGDMQQLLTKKTSAMINQETSNPQLINMIDRGNLAMIKIILTEGTGMMPETIVITKGSLTVTGLVVNT